jgi:hypothetical protein
LAIRDVSQAGHQPMSDRDGLVTVTFNDEIYMPVLILLSAIDWHGCSGT